jgi:hypothetical protein
MSPDQRRGDVVRWPVGQLFPQVFGAHLLPPELVRCRKIARPVGVLTVDLDAVVAPKVEVPRAQQLGLERHLLAEPLEVAGKDEVGRIGSHASTSEPRNKDRVASSASM